MLGIDTLGYDTWPIRNCSALLNCWALFSAASALVAASMAFTDVTLALVSRRFWAPSCLISQTNLSCKASDKYGPNLQ